MFGLRVAAALADKGVSAPAQDVIEAAERLIDSRQRNGTLRLLTSEQFQPTMLHGETPVHVQMLLANLDRNGATGIRLPLCPTCRTRKVVKVRTDDGPRECFRCSQRRSYDECPQCLRLRKLTAINADGQRVCQRCGPDGIPTFTCESCGNTVTTVGRIDGKRICLNCFPRRLRRCVSCGQQKKIAANILNGPHCFACHNRVLRNSAPCPGCAEKRILAFLDDDRQPCCAACAGQPARYACRRCGSEEHNYGRLCGRCVLSDRCNDILTGPNGEFTPPMRALRDYLLTQPRPVQIIKWLRMGPSTDLLRDIASERVSVESVLDVPRPSKPLIYLRTLLLDAGALSRNAAAATRQLMAWATQTIDDAPAEHRQMLRAYTRWALLRKASRDDSGDVVTGAAWHVKASLRGLVTFLTWAEEQETPLRALTQAQIEEFITLRSARRWLPQFLTWATEQDIVSDLDISTLPRREPVISASEEHLEHVIRVLATDRTIALDARLAALLIAVYGLPASKTLTLRRDQLRNDDGLVLIVGDRPLTLPEPIAVIVAEHLDALSETTPSDWLFPGLRPGKPRDPQYLNRRLRPLGVTISELQNAARFRLAGAVPSKILADMLDFSVATFENYARLSGSTRGDYPALRDTSSR